MSHQSQCFGKSILSESALYTVQHLRKITTVLLQLINTYLSVTCTRTVYQQNCGPIRALFFLCRACFSLLQPTNSLEQGNAHESFDLYCQIIEEFERILGLGTSVLSTFKANFHQVVDPILHVAKAKKGKAAEDVKSYLELLEDSDGDEMEPTAGKYYQ